MPTKTHYELLGVARDATPEAIDAAWRRQIKAHHPDRVADELQKRERTELSQRLHEAREVLSDPQRRAAYDLELDRDREHERLIAASEEVGRGLGEAVFGGRVDPSIGGVLSRAAGRMAATAARKLLDRKKPR